MNIARNTKWKWAGHIACIKDHRRTIRSTEWQIKGVRSVGSPKSRWRDDIVGATGSGMDKDSKGQRKLEDSGGGLLPAVEGHSLE